MTVLWGDTGKVSQGTLKEISFNYPETREQTAIGLTLPTTEPGTPQISYTVQESDLITFSNMTPLDYVIVPLLYAAGKIGAAAATLNYRMAVNGVSQVQSNNAGIVANNYYTYTVSRYAPVQVGDVVTFSLWANQPDVTLDYTAFTTVVTRMQLAPIGAILKDVKFGVGVAFPVATAQAPTPINIVSTQPVVCVPSNNVSSSITVVNSSSISYTMYALIQDPLYKVARSSYGDTINAVNLSASSAVNKFAYYRNWMPTTISFREIHL